MKNANWEVDIKTASLEEFEDPLLDDDDSEEEKKAWEKIKDGVHDYEISAIRKNNKHGHKSWGWPSADDKIILFSSHGNTLGDDDIVPRKNLDWAKKVAQHLCNVLNKMEEDKK